MTDIASLGFDVNSRELREGTRELDRMTGAARKTETATERLNREAQRQQRVLGQLSGALRLVQGALAGFGGVALVRSIAAVNDEYANITGRLRLVTSGTEELSRVQDELFNVAQRTGSAFGVTAELYTRVAQNAKDLGLTQRELIGFTETTTQAFLVSGASAAESAGAIRQLAQALASGVFRGEEFNSVAEQGPRILQALSDALGRSRGELRALAEDGKLTADVVIRALQGQAGAIQKEFDALPVTVSRAMQNLRNVVSQAIGEADAGPLVESIQDLQETISSPEISRGLQELASGLLSATAQGTKLLAVIGDNRTEIFTVALGALAIAAGRVGSAYAAQAAGAVSALSAQQAVNAQNAAGATLYAALTAAQVKETAAKIADTQATLAAVQAARAEQVARLQSATAKAAAAAATLQNIQATLTEGNVVQRTLAATLASVQANKARSASLRELAILGQQQARIEAALATATAANAAAQTRAAGAATASAAAIASTGVAARAAAAGMTVLNGALALVGGPVGLAITAALGIAFLISKMESAEDRSERLSNRLRELSGDLGAVGRAADTKELDETRNRIASLDTAISQLQQKLIANSGRSRGLLGDAIDSRASEKLKAYADERAKLVQIESALEDRLIGVVPATARVTEEAGKAETATEALARATGSASGAAKKAKDRYDEWATSLESAAAIQAEVERMQDAVNRQIEDAARAFEMTRTPLENYRAELEKLEMMRARFDAGLPGGITDQVYQRRLVQLQEELARAGAGYGNLTETAKTATDSLSVYADQAARNMQDAFADFLFDPFSKGLDGMLADFANILQRMAAEAAAAEIFSALGFGGSGGGIDFSGLIGIGASLFGGGVSATGTREAFNIGTADTGGWRPAGQPQLIGTGAQPELFVPDTAGTFYPAGEYGGAPNITINVPVYSATGTVDSRTRYQMAQDVARETQRVMGRS